MIEQVADVSSAVQDNERSAEQIRRDIDKEKQLISETVDQIKAKIRRRTDWRFYFRRYPALSLGVAAGLGFVSTCVVARRASPAQPLTSLRDRLAIRETQESSLKMLLLGLVTKLLTDSVRNSLYTQQPSPKSVQERRPQPQPQHHRFLEDQRHDQQRIEQAEAKEKQSPRRPHSGIEVYEKT